MTTRLLLLKSHLCKLSLDRAVCIAATILSCKGFIQCEGLSDMPPMLLVRAPQAQSGQKPNYQYFCITISSIRGDLLRSVPCVTVWHEKIISWILWAGEKPIKVWFLYVPRIIKNIGGHLPDLVWTDEKLLHFWVCHTVTPAFENHVNHLWS